MTDEVPDWLSAKTFHPQLIITTRSAVTVVEAVREEFRRVGYRVKESPSRTRLRYYEWFAIVAGDWSLTEVVLTPHADHVLLEVRHGSENRRGRKNGQRALNAALDGLRAQGIDLTIGEWHKKPSP